MSSSSEIYTPESFKNALVANSQSVEASSLKPSLLKLLASLAPSSYCFLLDLAGISVLTQKNY